MMVSIGGEMLIILVVLFTVTTDVTSDTCAQLAEPCESLLVYRVSDYQIYIYI